jgi:damage-control phosphatase, subfamily I
MMNLELDCIPCFVRHALEMANAASSDPAVHERVLRETFREMSEWDMGLPAPALSQRVQRRLHLLTGNCDPYRDAKRRFNEMALTLLPDLRSKVEAAADPFEAAVRVAVAGNVIDMGVNGNLSVDDVKTSLANSCTLPIAGDLGDFRRAVSRAEEILYLADNTGEIVFDRLLIEQLGKRRITIAVRGAAILNDATLADARIAGLDGIAEVIDNGSGAPGTILAECGTRFRERFERADIIIAKGQGNFETLAGEPGNIFFLLKVKCPVVAAHTGCEVGTHAVLHYSGGKQRNGWGAEDDAGASVEHRG